VKLERTVAKERVEHEKRERVLVDAQREGCAKLALDVERQPAGADAENHGSLPGLGGERPHDVEGCRILFFSPHPISMQVLVAVEHGRHTARRLLQERRTSKAGNEWLEHIAHDCEIRAQRGGHLAHTVTRSRGKVWTRRLEVERGRSRVNRRAVAFETTAPERSVVLWIDHQARERADEWVAGATTLAAICPVVR
jgi:hypothetical protein